MARTYAWIEAPPFRDDYQLALVETDLDAGTAGGWVLAVGTLGILAGVWGTSEFLVPTLGHAWTFRVAALSLAAGSFVLAFGARRAVSAAPSLKCSLSGTGDRLLSVRWSVELQREQLGVVTALREKLPVISPLHHFSVAER